MGGLYTISLKTGTIKGAGTDSNVYLTLFDKNGRSTREHDLDSKGDNFEKGDLDVFSMYDAHAIEDLKSFTLRKNNKNKYADWFVEYIKIRDHKNKKEYTKQLDKWFTKKDDCINVFPDISNVNKYSITIKTGTLKGAGTDSRIYMSFQDGKGKTTPEYYIDEKGDNFEKGAIETFYVDDNTGLKDLKNLIIRKENNNAYADWYVESIQIVDNHNNKKYDFLLNKWFTSNKRMFVIPVAEDLTTYKISIKTGEEGKGGTDAKLFIRLHGTKGSSPYIELDNKKDNFEKGDYDTFTVESSFNLGTIKKIRIGHQNQGKNPGWYCSFINVEDTSSGAIWSAPVYRWFSKSDDDKNTWRTITLRPGPINDVGEVYWCARDADVIGNHHFILIRYRNWEQCKRICKKHNLAYDAEKKGRVTHYFTTIGCFAKNTDFEDIVANMNPFKNYWGPLKVIINQKTDVKSVEQWIDPDNNISYYPWRLQLDLDIERHYMAPLPGMKGDEAVMDAVIKATQAFMDKYPNVPDYDLDDRNCATWANSLFKAIGYPSSYRREKSDFDGLDVANNNSINSYYFK